MENKIAEDILKILFKEDKLYFAKQLTKYEEDDHLEAIEGKVRLTPEQNTYIEKLHIERNTCGKCKNRITDLF